MSVLAILAACLFMASAVTFVYLATRHTHQRGDHPNGRCWICGASMPQETTMHDHPDEHRFVTPRFITTATLADGRPHQLLKVEESQVVDGVHCIVGVWVNREGVTRALVRSDAMHTEAVTA